MVKAEWKCLTAHPDLQRSSHTVSVIGHTAYVFGGEFVAREPRDNKVFAIQLDKPDAVTETTIASSAPSPRVGSASTTLNDKIYLFSGRGGTAMAPIDEQGGLWQYNPSASTWTLLKPADGSATVPPARSYHCMASDGKQLVYLHAGCPESGRLSDLWSFNVQSRCWTELSEAPAPSRGGTSIASSGSRLYRINGFDGKTEQGGSLDIFNLTDQSWSTRTYSADGVSGPEARSVAALLPLEVQGEQMLVTLFGEHDPSTLGHAGAGKMLSDCWLYDIAADEWQKIDHSSGPAPPARGWFDADVVDRSRIMVVGGLSETNERLSDVWTLSF